MSKSPDELLALADSAARVLDEPAFKEAHLVIEKSILAQIEACPIRDVEGLQLLVQLLKLHRKYLGVLQGAVETGKIEQIKLEGIRKDSRVSQMVSRFSR